MVRSQIRHQGILRVNQSRGSVRMHNVLSGKQAVNGPFQGSISLRHGHSVLTVNFLQVDPSRNPFIQERMMILQDFRLSVIRFKAEPEWSLHAPGISFRSFRFRCEKGIPIRQVCRKGCGSVLPGHDGLNRISGVQYQISVMPKNVIYRINGEFASHEGIMRCGILFYDGHSGLLSFVPNRGVAILNLGGLIQVINVYGDGIFIGDITVNALRLRNGIGSQIQVA